MSYNLYAYCLNNPVNRTDSEGNFGFWAVVGITLAASVIGAVGQIATNYLSGFRGRDLMTDVIGATVGSGLMAFYSCYSYDVKKSNSLFSIYSVMY